jgi:hypothetical protein
MLFGPFRVGNQSVGGSGLQLGVLVTPSLPERLALVRLLVLLCGSRLPMVWHMGVAGPF